MDWTDVNWIKQLILPPGGLLLLALAGLAWAGRAGRVTATCAVLGLAVAAMPVFERALNLALETAIPPADPRATPGAIVVLSGDYRPLAPEYGEATVGPSTLARLRHAAFMQRRTGLPILASGGGSPPGRHPDMGEAMRQTLERDFAVPVRWVEGRSRNTLENAVESARILRGEGIGAVVLVTHAYHMPRAARVFAAAGLQVVPAATGGVGAYGGVSLHDILPAASALHRSWDATNEILGLIGYEAVLAWRGGATR